jgi:hypothetical protein
LSWLAGAVALSIWLATALVSTASAAPIPLSQVPPAPEPPAVTFPADGATVNQATDAITFAPHDGVLQYVFVATSPTTLDQKYGRPPSADPQLADQVAIIYGGGQGATRVPLSSWPRTLPPGRYWFNAWWTYQKTYEACIVTLAPSGDCDPAIAPISYAVMASRYTQPTSFVIAGPPAVAPVATTARHVARPAACTHYRAVLAVNARQLVKARHGYRVAKRPPARRAFVKKIRKLNATRATLTRYRTAACRLA